MIKKQFLILLTVFLPVLIYSQTQTIRGTVSDESSGQPIPFANVFIPDTDTQTGTVTDSTGNFRLVVPSVGRYTIQISFIGYEPYIMKEITVSSGKETYLDIKLKESTWMLGEVIIKSEVNKEQPLNKMAVTSARMFSVEEANRYAGGFDDPARLVSSFAGVAGSVSTNGITVRGNSPQFLQWKLEGVEIPNPTHFPDVTGIGGGIITALSSQVLGNSDFLTGAFPAEYGNALSGVFDVKLRTGNNQNYENTFQVGTIGIEYASEGPFRKGGKASYLFNYRYSSLSLADKIIPGGLGEAGGLKYQDLSFKLNFPTKKIGIFTIWGIGTFDRYSDEASADTTKWITEDNKFSAYSKQYMAASGVGHKIYIGNDAFVQTSLAFTFRNNALLSQRFNNNAEKLSDFDLQAQNSDIIFSSFLNKKFSARHYYKTGINFKGMFYDLDYKIRYPYTTQLVSFANSNGNSLFAEIYSSSAIDLTRKITVNLGLHGSLFTLNKHWTVEPRASIKWQIDDIQSLALAYGLHSRHEKIDYYFVRSKETGELVNKNLDFTKAHHIVFAYNLRIKENIHLKIEPYFQYLFDVPVSPDSSFSIINHKLWFLDTELVNDGKGINYGIDITFERYMNNGYYYMITGSLFNSRYMGGDGVWRNTRLNRNFLLNVLWGKEWFIGKQKRNVLGVNLKFSFMGGERYTHVHPDATTELIVDRNPLYDESQAYKLQQKPVFISNFTINYKINRKKTSHEFSIKILNANGYKEFLGYTYNYQTKSFTEVKEAFVIPGVSWKWDF